MDDMVMDAVDVDAIDAVVDDAVAEGEHDGTEAQAEAVIEDVKGDERVIPQWMRDLKASNPSAFKEAKNIFFGKRSLDDKLKDFDVDGVRTKLDEFGGIDGLMSSYKEREDKASALDIINNQVMSGDPNIAKAIAESSGEHFPKIAAATLSEWSSRDPEGYNAAVYGALGQVIRTQEGIPSLFGKDQMVSMPTLITEARAAMYSADADVKAQIASAVMERISGFVTSLQQQGTARPQQQAQAQGKGTSVAQERQDWEREKFTTGLTEAEQAQRTPMVNQELASYFAVRPNDADAKELAIATLTQRVANQLAKDATFQSSKQAFMSRGDRDGALKLIKSRESAAIKALAPAVGKAVYGAPAAVKAPAVVATRTASRPGGVAPAPNSFSAIWDR